MSKFYLKGLDTYRAIAALVVLISHVELFKANYGLKNFSYLFVNTGGHTAVVLFFSLSGFLITYLLMKEKTENRQVSLKNFYMRRILRVWPLYFLIILSSYFLTNYNPDLITLVLCLTIFPNIAHALGRGWSVSPQIWSVGVEEQFYLMWPLLIKKFKNVLFISVLIFIIFSLLPYFLVFTLNRVYPNPQLISIINKLFYGTKFNCMAAGAILAIGYLNKHKFITILYANKMVSYFLLLLPFCLWLTGFNCEYFNDEIYAVLFSVSILMISTNPGILNIDNVVSSFLGKISYGIYMYHWIVLELVFRNKIFAGNGDLIFNILLYATELGITILLATLSYHYIEKPFLRFKERFNTDEILPVNISPRESVQIIEDMGTERKISPSY